MQGTNPEPWTSIIAAGGDVPGSDSLHIRRSMLNAAELYHPTRHDAHQLRHCLMLINKLLSQERATPRTTEASQESSIIRMLFAASFDDLAKIVAEFL